MARFIWNAMQWGWSMAFRSRQNMIKFFYTPQKGYIPKFVWWKVKGQICFIRFACTFSFAWSKVNMLIVLKSRLKKSKVNVAIFYFHGQRAKLRWRLIIVARSRTRLTLRVKGRVGLVPRSWWWGLGTRLFIACCGGAALQLRNLTKHKILVMIA